MEQITLISMSPTDSTKNGPNGLDFEDEKVCLEDATTICTQNQISDLIIASEVNKILLAR